FKSIIFRTSLKHSIICLFIFQNDSNCAGGALAQMQRTTRAYFAGREDKLNSFRGRKSSSSQLLKEATQKMDGYKLSCFVNSIRPGDHSQEDGASNCK
ncbi:hypothetical protein CDAR_550751, partial [Caerostris darwini]